MNQSGLKAYNSAKNIALSGIILIIISAFFDLNHFPFNYFVSSVEPLSLVNIVELCNSYSSIFFILFLLSRPAKKSIFFVLGFAIISSVLSLFGGANTVLYKFKIDCIGDNLTTFITLATIPAVILLLLRTFTLIKSSQNSIYEKNLTNLLILVFLLIGIPSSALEFGISVQPTVMDFIALHWDIASHLNITPELYRIVNAVPGLPNLVSLAYAYTPVWFLMVAAVQLGGFPKQTASGAKTWVVLSACALLAYHFFPMTGPQYIFGTDHYIKMLGDYSQFPLRPVFSGQAARNGMPSMHFGWMLASTILWWRTGSAWWSRALFIIATLLTATATIYLGEHYVIDLIVAVPFTLAAIALCTDNVSWSRAERKWTVIGGFLTWFVWIIVLRQLVPFAEQHPWFCWLMNGCTAVVVFFQSVAMKRFTPLAKLPADDATADSRTNTPFFSTNERKSAPCFLRQALLH